MRFHHIARTALLVSSFALLGATQAETVRIGATEVPHAEILEVVKPALAKDGVDLDIKVFSDYVQPNMQLASKDLDANFFQHQPYLDSFNADRGTNLVAVALVHVEPFGVYSRKIKSLAELAALPERATVAIPNDPSNSGRALLLLQEYGFIKLKDESNIVATPLDIAENPKNLRFRELEAAILPRVLDDVDLALINTNFAMEAGLVPTRDALLIEGAESPYANILVVRDDNKDAPAIKKLADALRTPAVKAFIEKKYQGAIVPAF